MANCREVMGNLESIRRTVEGIEMHGVRSASPGTLSDLVKEIDKTRERIASGARVDDVGCSFQRMWRMCAALGQVIQVACLAGFLASGEEADPLSVGCMTLSFLIVSRLWSLSTTYEKAHEGRLQEWKATDRFANGLRTRVERMRTASA